MLTEEFKGRRISTATDWYSRHGERNKNCRQEFEGQHLCEIEGVSRWREDQSVGCACLKENNSGARPAYLTRYLGGRNTGRVKRMTSVKMIECIHT
jgi:hypothetical protein